MKKIIITTLFVVSVWANTCTDLNERYQNNMDYVKHFAKQNNMSVACNYVYKAQNILSQLTNSGCYIDGSRKAAQARMMRTCGR